LKVNIQVTYLKLNLFYSI